MATTTLQCNCNSDFQDKTYGKGMRLFNTGDSGKSTKARCSICGRIIDIKTQIKPVAIKD